VDSCGIEVADSCYPLTGGTSWTMRSVPSTRKCHVELTSEARYAWTRAGLKSPTAATPSRGEPAGRCARFHRPTSASKHSNARARGGASSFLKPHQPPKARSASLMRRRREDHLPYGGLRSSSVKRSPSGSLRAGQPQRRRQTRKGRNPKGTSGVAAQCGGYADCTLNGGAMYLETRKLLVHGKQRDAHGARG
jgi:hypothetical protein